MEIRENLAKMAIKTGAVGQSAVLSSLTTATAQGIAAFQKTNNRLPTVDECLKIYHTDKNLSMIVKLAKVNDAQLTGIIKETLGLGDENAGTGE